MKIHPYNKPAIYGDFGWFESLNDTPRIRKIALLNFKETLQRLYKPKVLHFQYIIKHHSVPTCQGESPYSLGWKAKIQTGVK